MYRDFAPNRICVARKAYAFDTTTIDLPLSLFTRTRLRKTEAVVKLHTLHEVKVLNSSTFEPSSFYMLDRGFPNLARLYRLHLAHAFFVTNAKSNLQAIDKATGLRCNQIIILPCVRSCTDYPVPL